MECLRKPLSSTVLHAAETNMTEKNLGQNFREKMAQNL